MGSAPQNLATFSRKDQTSCSMVLVLVGQAGCLGEQPGIRTSAHMLNPPLPCLMKRPHPIKLNFWDIYLFISLVYRLCRKGISWHRAGSKEFGSSPEKSVTGLGFFSSDLKEFISSSHINKPYACLGNKIITTTLHIHITICPFLFRQQFFHGLKWKGKKNDQWRTKTYQ